MKFWSQLGERELDLTVQVKGQRVDVAFEGRNLVADFEPLPDGKVFSLILDGRVHEVAVEEDGTAYMVALRGRRHRVLVRNPLEKVLREVKRDQVLTTGETIESPIPGLVVAIKVKPGDLVKAGQPVIVVEAMKMQNELSSQGDGIVETVLVQERQSVDSGARLIVLKPPPAETA
jgi:biotin carboxyl carrier protein